jgi:hypothetical protein
MSVSYITFNQFLQPLSHVNKKKNYIHGKEVEHGIGYQKTMGNLHFPDEKNWIIGINPEYDTQKPPFH